MKIVVRFTKKGRLKAIPIIYRHSPSIVLPNGTYVLSEEAVQSLREAGVQFKELGKDSGVPGSQEVATSERI